jgi:hypothetical protein
MSIFYHRSNFICLSLIFNTLNVELKLETCYRISLLYAINITYGNKELGNFQFSSNIVRVIKSRTVKWTGHVARMGNGKYL